VRIEENDGKKGIMYLGKGKIQCTLEKEKVKVYFVKSAV
jgi:hypothetical protein